MERRDFVISGTLCLGALLSCKNQVSNMSDSSQKDSLFFKTSLAQWSLHRAFQNGDLDVRNFAKIARTDYDIEAVEYVNQFYIDHATDVAYWNDMKQRATDHDVKSLLIMVDDEGDLGNPEKKSRNQAVENHFKWVDVANILGCHSIRINAFGEGSKEEVASAMIDGLGQLCTYAQEANINVLIENHGLFSSDAQWVSNVITQVGMSNCGTLPDFGNFCLSKKWGSSQDGTCTAEYDRYQGVQEMMPYAFGVSAKSYGFNDKGDETTINFKRMLEIVKSFRFDGYIGVEYEGEELSEDEGIKATKRLLEKVGGQLS